MDTQRAEAIKRAMQEAGDAADAAAIAAFGQAAADVCAALADLANQMKFMVQIVDGDLTEVAVQHARFLARVVHGVCQIGGLDARAFEDMMFRIAEARLYIHDESRKPNG